MEPIKTAGVAIIEEGTILLVRHRESAGNQTGIYGVPAGKIQSGETERQAAARELFEETGLTTLPEDLIELPTVQVAEIQRKDGLKLFSLKTFLADAYAGVLKESAETTPEWIPIAELKGYKLLPSVEKIVEEALEALKKIEPNDSV